MTGSWSKFHPHGLLSTARPTAPQTKAHTCSTTVDAGGRGERFSATDAIAWIPDKRGGGQHLRVPVGGQFAGLLRVGHVAGAHRGQPPAETGICGDNRAVADGSAQDERRQWLGV